MLPLRNRGADAVNQLVTAGEFIIRSSPERVWDILGSVILRCLPLEKIDIADESNFSAALRVPLTFFSLSFDMRGLLDLDPPNSMICLLQGDSWWKVVSIDLKVGFTLGACETNSTLVRWSATREESKRKLVRRLLARKEKRFTEDIIDDIRKTLERLAN